MIYLKTLGITFAADILSMFISLTLASFSSTFIRLISAVCTMCILIFFISSFSIKFAHNKLRIARINKTKSSISSAIPIGLISSLPAAASWIILYISHSTGNFDFYRWHKIINAYFLQIYNFINSNASVTDLRNSQLALMLPLVFIPFLTVMISYTLVYRKETIMKSRAK